MPFCLICLHYLLLYILLTILDNQALCRRRNLLTSHVVGLTILLGSSSGSLLRHDGLDDTDSNGLLHVTDSETAKRRVLHERLNAQRLRRDNEDKSGVTVLDVLRLSLELLARPAVKLLQQLVELARNVRRVAVKDRRVALPDLPGGAMMMMTRAVKFSQPVAGLFFASDATCPRRMPLTVTVRTLNMTL